MVGELHTPLGWFPVTVQMAAVMSLAVPSIACADRARRVVQLGGDLSPRQTLQHLR